MIRVDREDAVAVVTVDRQEALNALDVETLTALRDRLRDLAGHAETRVVVLTGMDDDEVARRAADAGASACLTKGAVEREVVETILAVADARVNL